MIHESFKLDWSYAYSIGLRIQVDVAVIERAAVDCFLAVGKTGWTSPASVPRDLVPRATARLATCRSKASSAVRPPPSALKRGRIATESVFKAYAVAEAAARSVDTTTCFDVLDAYRALGSRLAFPGHVPSLQHVRPAAPTRPCAMLEKQWRASDEDPSGH
ncbi:MAG: hypothetical protein JSS47_11815, partial [Proteobacteria bacterium]|nr:hypothetical protein [Pseudomonadota bacterium]